MVEEAREAGQALVDDFDAALEKTGIRYGERVEEGNAAERVLEQADRAGADLIVAGAHSVSAGRRIAFGSTTHSLLENGTLPLFLFH